MDRNKILNLQFEKTERNVNKYGRSTMTIGELMDIEDIDLRKFIFMKISNAAYWEYTTKKIDNEEKIGYYKFQVKLNMNKNGNLYERSILMEYIVYNKATKKVKLSRAGQNYTVYRSMLEDYFSSVEVIDRLNIKPTATLCKKVIEGSISTVSDFVKYLRSYVLKKKDIPLDIVYKFVVMKVPYLLEVVEDPESIMDMDEINVDLNYYITNLKLFKCKLSEVKDLNKKYDDWNKEQMSKFTRLRGSRDAPLRLTVGI